MEFVVSDGLPYVATNRWVWKGAQQMEKATTTAT